MHFFFITESDEKVLYLTVIVVVAACVLVSILLLVQLCTRPPRPGPRPAPLSVPNDNDTAIPRSPDLPTLENFPRSSSRKINILDEIPNSASFGILLLDDRRGNTISALQEQFRDIHSINRAILQRWLNGHGKRPVTWAILVETMRDVGLNTLAKDIGDVLTDCGIEIREKTD